MGYYYVRQRRKGMILNSFDIKNIANTIPDDWIPTQDWVNAQYPDAQLTNYENFSREAKLIILGTLKEIPYEYCRGLSVNDINEDMAMKVYADENERRYMYLSALAVVYCYAYGYPARSFDCLSDYNCTWMFIATIDFPPVTYNDKLGRLTEGIFADELSRFLAVVTGEKYEPKIGICREFNKE